MFNKVFSQRQPDFAGFVDMITGKISPQRVYCVELGIDPEVVRYIWEKYLCLPPTADSIYQKLECWYHLGYDFVRYAHAFSNLPDFSKRSTLDTAELSRGQRNWVDQQAGLVGTWEDYHRIDWQNIAVDYATLAVYKRHLRPGMKLLLSYPLFETVLEHLMGYRGLLVGIIRQPDLVKAVFSTWGQKVWEFYSALIDDEAVGGIFHADDFGYKTATIISPRHLEEYVFPWLHQYAQLAHSRGKVFFLHSCGKIEALLDYLLTEVKIDALHSFQDAIMPVTEFKRRYPQAGALGGVDVDKLVRFTPEQLRQYVGAILRQMMQQGRYALGSGNSITNYIPVENYLTMLAQAADFG